MSDDASHDASPDVLTSAAQGRLRTIVERLERLEEDKAAVMADAKEVFAEAKGEGYDVKILRKVLRHRKMDPAKRQEESAILDLYLTALGEAPLFESAGVTVHVSTRAAPRGPGTSEPTLNTEVGFKLAVELVRADDGKASVSWLQRRLQVGYNRAASIMELLEQRGIVSTADHAGKRTVLPWNRGDGGEEPQPAAVH
jgi:uncharacterized protein (UPF0335 family)